MFLDRDGTLNREVDYLSEVDDFELLPGAGEALAALQSAGYLLVVVTNQSGIARGLLDEPRLAEIHERMRRDLARFGVHLDWIGWCPDHPTEGRPPYRRDSERRKPGPGMLREAAAELAIDLARSWCVGDSLRDLEAGERLGVPGILVATGKGAAEAERARVAGRPVDRLVPDLRAAAELILASGSGRQD